MEDQVALGVETHHLATRAYAGVHAHHPFLSERGSEEQLSQVFRKDPDGLLVGFLFGGSGKLILYRGCQQAFVGIAHRLFNHLLAASA